jgi:hypothetical protein
MRVTTRSAESVFMSTPRSSRASVRPSRQRDRARRALAAATAVEPPRGPIVFYVALAIMLLAVAALAWVLSSLKPAIRDGYCRSWMQSI